MNKQFVAWARVSSARQKKEGFSLEDQEARLLEFAGRLGGTVVKLFKIAETASKQEERIAFREFTAYVKKNARTLSGMLFVKVDRAARNIRDWADLEALAEESRVPLFFPDQPTGETPAGRMQRRMSAVFASYQTDQQATDIRAGHKRRVESGLPLGRPYGYRNVRVNGRSIIEHDPIEASKVKRIFELFAYRRHTVDSLREELARQGIAYTDRTPKFPRNTLYKILRNRHVLGEVKYHGTWYPGRFEPLVDRATYNAVQARFTAKVCIHAELLFAGGLMTCEHCGHLVTGETKRKTSPGAKVREYTYYFCSHYTTKGHPRTRRRQAEVEACFRAVFDRLRIADPVIRSWIVEVIKARAHAGQEQNRQHRAEIERQRSVIDAKLKALLDLRVDGEISAEDYAAKRSELDDRLAGVRLQLESSDRDDAEVADLAIKTIELSQTLRTRWENAGFAEKRQILDILCKTVRWNSAKIEICLRKPFEMIAGGELVPLNGAEETRTLNP